MSPASWEMTVLKHQQAKLGGRFKVVFKADLFHVSEQICSVTALPPPLPH
jgi:hypothetical protein